MCSSSSTLYNKIYLFNHHTCIKMTWYNHFKWHWLFCLHYIIKMTWYDISSLNRQFSSINLTIIYHKNPLFFLYSAAELAWHEMRRAWVGDGSQTSHTKFRQPILRFDFQLSRCHFYFVGPILQVKNKKISWKNCLYLYGLLLQLDYKFWRFALIWWNIPWSNSISCKLLVLWIFPQLCVSYVTVGFLQDVVDLLVDIWIEEGLYN